MNGIQDKGRSLKVQKPLSMHRTPLTTSILSAFILFFLLAPAVFAADAKRGEALFEYCAPCHGNQAEGNHELKAPPLAGQESWYIEAQLKKFQEGVRGTNPHYEPGRRMRPMAMTLKTAEDMQLVAAYISGLKAVKAEATLQGGQAETGRTLFNTCLACHGPEGKGNPVLKAPALVTSSDWYLFAQLQNFKSGIRGASPKDITGMQMRPMAMTLADEQAVKDVIAFIMTLR